MDAQTTKLIDMLTRAGNDHLTQIVKLKRDVAILRNQMTLLRIEARGRAARELRTQAEADDE